MMVFHIIVFVKVIIVDEMFELYLILMVFDDVDFDFAVVVVFVVAIVVDDVEEEEGIENE